MVRNVSMSVWWCNCKCWCSFCTRELRDVTGGPVGSQVFPNGMVSYVYNMGVTEHSLHNTSLININHRIHLDPTKHNLSYPILIPWVVVVGNKILHFKTIKIFPKCSRQSIKNALLRVDIQWRSGTKIPLIVDWQLINSTLRTHSAIFRVRGSEEAEVRQCDK